MRSIRAGFVGFGEVNTPKEVILSLCQSAANRLKEQDWDIVYAEPVSDDEAYEEADRAVQQLQGHEFDLLVVCVAGWIPTHAVIRVTDRFRHLPMLLWGLTGWMEEGRLVTTAPQAGTSALRPVMAGLGYRFRYVYSTVDQPYPADKIDAFGRAARAASLLREARIGSMGYRDMLLYGTPVDILSLRREIGIEVECFEMLEIVRGLDLVDENEVQETLRYCLDNWTFAKQPDQETLIRGIKYYLVLKQKIEKRKYQAVSLIDVDGMKKLEGFPPAMVFMLIADLLDVCTTPENDIVGNTTQLMVRYLTGQTAHYMEFYEYFADRVLIGVPDYVPSDVVRGDVTLLPAKFGSFTGSLLNVSKVKDGPVTLMRLVEDRGRYSMHMAFGQAVQPRSWEEYGWEQPAPQLPSLEVILEEPVESFVDKIMSQHTIIAYGDIRAEMKQLCSLLNIPLL